MKIHVMKFQAENDEKAAQMAEGFAAICSIDGNYWSGELTGEKTPEGWYIAHIKEGKPNDAEAKTIC